MINCLNCINYAGCKYVKTDGVPLNCEYFRFRDVNDLRMACNDIYEIKNDKSNDKLVNTLVDTIVVNNIILRSESNAIELKVDDECISKFKTIIINGVRFEKVEK